MTSSIYQLVKDQKYNEAISHLQIELTVRDRGRSKSTSGGAHLKVPVQGFGRGCPGGAAGSPAQRWPMQLH
jgi:hypothetical protein